MPYSKETATLEALPVFVRLPFKVALVVDTPLAGSVATTGGEVGVAVVKVKLSPSVSSVPYRYSPEIIGSTGGQAGNGGIERSGFAEANRYYWCKATIRII